MAEFVLSAFADEAGSSLEEQIAALKDNGIGYIEPRNIGGKGILSLSDEEVYAVRAALDLAGIKVNSLGSPIGKYPIDKPFEEHLEAFHRAIRVCKMLNTENMRMFSFYPVAGEPTRACTDEVIRRLRELARIAKNNGIQLNHENEKAIFGQNPEEVALILDEVPELRAVFDGANYREAGCDVMDGINATLKSFGYMHIKDAIHSPKMIVPAGEGEARLAEIIDIVNEKVGGRVYLTVEPHLHIFDAFKDIDNTELVGKYTFKTNREAFDFAVNALKGLLTKQGYKEVDGVWKK